MPYRRRCGRSDFLGRDDAADPLIHPLSPLGVDTYMFPRAWRRDRASLEVGKALHQFLLPFCALSGAREAVSVAPAVLKHSADDHPTSLLQRNDLVGSFRKYPPIRRPLGQRDRCEGPAEAGRIAVQRGTQLTFHGTPVRICSLLAACRVHLGDLSRHLPS
jgi:hypothetical protein